MRCCEPYAYARVTALFCRDVVELRAMSGQCSLRDMSLHIYGQAEFVMRREANSARCRYNVIKNGEMIQRRERRRYVGRRTNDEEHTFERLTHILILLIIDIILSLLLNIIHNIGCSQRRSQVVTFRGLNQIKNEQKSQQCGYNRNRKCSGKSRVWGISVG